MYYFLKDRKMHRFPAPARCGARYEDEKLWDYKVDGAEECVYCLRRWPGDDD